MKAIWKKYTLNFKRPSGTSRGVMNHKSSWFIICKKDNKIAIGECGRLKGLSIDPDKEYENVLDKVCENINNGIFPQLENLNDFPSIQFGVEMVDKSIKSPNPYNLFPSDFTQSEHPIPINGLIWMGEKKFMLSQIQEKLNKGYDCIKLKIGAINFKEEIELLKFIRREFDEKEIEIRVDANGAFSHQNALEKLKILSDLKLHSIEQPIRQGHWEKMAELCSKTPLPIALDEELIGVKTSEVKKSLLEVIQPQYIILKPSLIGGFQKSEEWINLANQNQIGWWVTSALESNIGLNAISQWCFTLDSNMHQGLGTGQLYVNNVVSPLEVENGNIYYRNSRKWDISQLIS